MATGLSDLIYNNWPIVCNYLQIIVWSVQRLHFSHGSEWYSVCSFWHIVARSYCFYLQNWRKAIYQHVLQSRSALAQDEKVLPFLSAGMPR